MQRLLRMQARSGSTGENCQDAGVSGTLRTISASSFFIKGFMTKAEIPASFAFSGDAVSPCPVERMMGIFSEFEHLTGRVKAGQIRHGLVGDDKIEP
jgi:hypothetical protein